MKYKNLNFILRWKFLSVYLPVVLEREVTLCMLLVVLLEFKKYSSENVPLIN